MPNENQRAGETPAPRLTDDELEELDAIGDQYDFRPLARRVIAEVRRLREELNVTRNLVTMLGRDLDAARARVKELEERNG